MCSSEVRKINTTFEKMNFFFVCICGVRNIHSAFTQKKKNTLFMHKEFWYCFYKNNKWISCKRKFVLYVIWNMKSFDLLYVILVYEKYSFNSFDYPLVK